MAKIRVFLDTDVIISSLLSKTGASNYVINNPKIERIAFLFLSRFILLIYFVCSSVWLRICSTFSGNICFTLRIKRDLSLALPQHLKLKPYY